MGAPRVLIVDTPAHGLWSLAARLAAGGLDVVEAVAGGAAPPVIGRGVGALLVHHAVTADIEPLLDLVLDIDPDLALFVVGDGVGGSQMPSALGPAEVLRVSDNPEDLVRRIRRAVAGAAHRRQLRAWQRSTAGRLGADALLGESESVARVRLLVRKLAASAGVPTIISGPQGAGRTYLARIVHDTSERHAQPFVTVDCTRRPSLAATIFGSGDGVGAVEGADEGTLLLERVERLTPDLQVRLLRLLEEGVFRRGDSTFDRTVDVRVVASTSVDLDAEVEAGRFRSDLYYRLNIVRLDLPLLRRRGRDVLLLAAHMAAREGVAHRLTAVRIDAAAQEILLRYAWPGNVSELRHVVARAVMLSPRDTLTADDFALIDPATSRTTAAALTLPDGGVNLHDLERRLVVEALERTGGNQTRAAELLGLHRDQIRYRMLKYGLRR